MALHDLTMAEAGAKVRSGEISSTELTRAVLDRIRAVEPKVDAFLTVMEDEALATAKRFDETPKAQRPNSPVAGVPIALKDIFCTKGVKTTCASKLLANFVPPYDAAVVSKLRDAGAVLVGKLNMDEFAMGSSCENSGFKRTRNPWDLERVPGGSSGGSAAAVAAGMCMGTLGTDTGGSIRQPSALTNLVGIKPTYGRVSRYGVIAFASSLDQVGPMCRTAEDAALLLGVIAGHDPSDSTSLDDAVPDYSKSLRQDVKGLRLGVPKEYLIDGMDPEVRALFDKALGQYKDAGAEIVETTLPHTEYGIATYYIIAPAEASSNLSRYDGVRYGVRAKIDSKTEGLAEMISRTRSEGFGKEVQRRIMIGTYVLSAGYYDAFYKKAQQVRTLIRKDFEEAFKKVDLIITPTTPTAAFKIGEKSEDPVAMYLSDVFTVTTNIAGLPGLSMPCGFTKTGLPLGIQLIGGHLAEPAIFRAADAFERMNDYTKRRPAL